MINGENWGWWLVWIVTGAALWLVIGWLVLEWAMS